MKSIKEQVFEIMRSNGYEVDETVYESHNINTNDIIRLISITQQLTAKQIFDEIEKTNKIYIDPKRIKNDTKFIILTNYSWNRLKEKWVKK